MRRENQYSEHHILPKSREWSSNEHNLLYIKESTHRAIHTLFQNQMIGEQLINMVWLSAKALKWEVVWWLLDTFMSKDIRDPSQRYKDEVIKKPQIFIPKK